MGDNNLFSWIRGSDVPEHNGNLIADALKGGRTTEYLEGEIDEYEGNPVLVAKYWERDGDEENWTVKISIPNGPHNRNVTQHYPDQFTAEAVFEKLALEYDLDPWEPEEGGD